MQREITIQQIKDKPVDILSEFQNQLLVGWRGSSQLYIYDMRLGSVFTIHVNGQVYDALWSPYGNYVICLTSINNIIVMLPSGHIVKSHRVARLGYFTASRHDIILLTAIDNDVYQTEDDGITWTLMFRFTLDIGSKLLRLIKVKANIHINDDEYWSLQIERDQLFLKIHSMGPMSTLLTLKRLIHLPIKLVNDNAIMAFNGYTTVMVGDVITGRIFIFSTNNQENSKSLEPALILLKPMSISIDSKDSVIYVGHKEGLIRLYQF